MKKILLIVVIFIILGVGGFFVYKKVISRPKDEARKTITSKKPEVNLLEREKRPYVTLIPRADGREVSMTINDLKNQEELVEYELEYQAGSMLQGAGGRIDFSEEPAPVTKKLLFGSCSKGKCKYDEDVSGGSLTLYFTGQEEYGLKTEFTLNKMEDKKGVFTSRDVKTSLDVGEKGLDNDVFVIVASTMGLPASPAGGPSEVGGEVVAGPIGFFTAEKQTIKKATLTFKGIKAEGNLKVLGWDGSNWQEYETKLEDNTATAQVDQLATFVLVK